MKSNAPSFIACTTVAVRPWPEMTMTGTSRSIFLNAASAPSPSIDAGHDDVDDHGVGPLGVVLLHRLLGVVDRDAVIAEAVEEHPQEFADGVIVVDDHDLRFVAHRLLFASHSGSTTKQSRCRKQKVCVRATVTSAVKQRERVDRAHDDSQKGSQT